MSPKGFCFAFKNMRPGGEVFQKISTKRRNYFKNISPKGGFIQRTFPRGGELFQEPFLQGGNYFKNIPRGELFQEHVPPGGNYVENSSSQGGKFFLRTFPPRRNDLL